MTPRIAALAVLLLPVALAGRGQTSPQAQAPDTARRKVEAGVARLYDTSVLHRIDIAIAAEDADRIIARTDERVRATFTMDGRTLTDIGVRQSGGVYHPYQPITNKPSLSLKFDEFVDGQRLFDLERLILKNELQDVSFLSEHLTYEIFRRAGLAAPFTAHARVTINGIDSGIYLMREPITKQFLTRNFGSAAKGGNLYEIENTRDFVYDPTYPALDDEGKDGRTRTDLVALAKAIQATTGDAFVRDLSPMLDIDGLVTFVAAEIATGHWDGLTYRNNNTYVYAHPKDGRFIFLPWGADQALGLGRGGFWGANSPQSALVQKLLAVPALAARVQAEVTRIRRAPVWNQDVLLDRIDRAARVIASADASSGRTAADVGRFNSWRATVEGIIRNNGQ